MGDEAPASNTCAVRLAGGGMGRDRRGGVAQAALRAVPGVPRARVGLEGGPAEVGADAATPPAAPVAAAGQAGHEAEPA